MPIHTNEEDATWHMVYTYNLDTGTAERASGKKHTQLSEAVVVAEAMVADKKATWRIRPGRMLLRPPKTSDSRNGAMIVVHDRPDRARHLGRKGDTLPAHREAPERGRRPTSDRASQL